MDCVEFKKMIRWYFEGSLNDYQLDEFADHVIACTACEKHLLSKARSENTPSQQASE